MGLTRKTVEPFVKYQEEHGFEQAIIRFGYTSETGKRYLRAYRNLLDMELLKENVRLSKRTQKFQDTNRIERKSFREQARIENAVEELGVAICDQLKEHAKALEVINITTETREGEAVGIVHITDLHANELINLPHNKYDFKVLAKRAKLYISDCIDEFKHKGVKRVLFAATGDLLNSDRRLDELLNSATNRSKAAILTAHIIKQMLLELLSHGFIISVVSVVGNESRMSKELSYSDNVLSDNYDFLIMAMLKQMFKFAKIENITFVSIDKLEEVVSMDGQNWLLTHDLSKFTSKQEKTQAAIGRYSLNGIYIDYIIGGHIHATRITDLSSRASSFSGSNSFNEKALNLSGRAAGTFYIIKNGRRLTYNVDLQNADSVKGYEIVQELEAYNAKSSNKLKPHKAVLEIVI